MNISGTVNTMYNDTMRTKANNIWLYFLDTAHCIVKREFLRADNVTFKKVYHYSYCKKCIPQLTYLLQWCVLYNKVLTWYMKHEMAKA